MITVTPVGGVNTSTETVFREKESDDDTIEVRKSNNAPLSCSYSGGGVNVTN